MNCRVANSVKNKYSKSVKLNTQDSCAKGKENKIYTHEQNGFSNGRLYAMDEHVHSTLGTFWQYNTRLMPNRTTVLSANNLNRKAIKCRK